MPSPSLGGSFLPGATYSMTGTIAGPTPLRILTAQSSIPASESGTTYVLSATVEFDTVLPLPAAGLRYTFIVGAAPSSASYTITTKNIAGILKGVQLSAAGDAGDTTSADNTITFVDGQAVAGDRIDLVSDGVSWFCTAYTKVAAGLTYTTVS